MVQYSDVLCSCNEDTSRLILKHSIYYKTLKHIYILQVPDDMCYEMQEPIYICTAKKS